MSQLNPNLSPEDAARRANNWLRELEKLDAARADGAGLLRICRMNDPAIEEVQIELDKLDHGQVVMPPDLYVEVPNPSPTAGNRVYVEPPPPVPVLEYAKETKLSLAQRLEETGSVTFDSLP